MAASNAYLAKFYDPSYYNDNNGELQFQYQIDNTGFMADSSIQKTYFLVPQQINTNNSWIISFLDGYSLRLFGFDYTNISFYNFGDAAIDFGYTSYYQVKF